MKKQPLGGANPTLRSSEPTFDFGERCLFCSKPAKLTGNKRGHDVFPVRTLDFQTTLNRICEERRDGWAEEVHGRISFSQDLIDTHIQGGFWTTPD